MDFRIGIGFDVHSFKKADKIILCNLEIPSDVGLVGHSDADAPLHALTDALLGALGLGDIGLHFPDNDDRYLGIDSSLLLKQVWSMVRERGYVLANCDLTIIAQKPKISPYRQAMCQRLAQLLETDISRINIKGTTTERLGFVGREEGLAAQAAVCLRKD